MKLTKIVYQDIELRGADARHAREEGIESLRVRSYLLEARQYYEMLADYGRWVPISAEQLRGWLMNQSDAESVNAEWVCSHCAECDEAGEEHYACEGCACSCTSDEEDWNC